MLECYDGICRALLGLTRTSSLGKRNRNLPDTVAEGWSHTGLNGIKSSIGMVLELFEGYECAFMLPRGNVFRLCGI